MTGWKDLTYEISEVSSDFVYGRFDYPSMHLIDTAVDKCLHETETQQGTVGDSDDLCLDVEDRKSTVAWLYKNKKLRKAIDKVIKQINKEYFACDIPDGAEDYQITIYDDPADHYDWHQDAYDDDADEGFKRTLSTSICLSSDDQYEGAEFFIEDGCKQNTRVFKMKFGDFIVFEAETNHKINALRDGQRISLVIWYGFKT